MKHTVNIAFSLLLLLVVISAFTCQSPSVGGCAKLRHIVAFVDFDVPDNSDDHKAVQQDNQRRFDQIAESVELNFASKGNIRPVYFDTYPLYFSTSSNTPVYSFYTGKESTCDALESDKKNILKRFDPYTAFDDFYAQKIATENRYYKQIWPAVRSIAECISTSRAKEIVIVFYSDMIESWTTNQNEPGVYNFTDPVITGTKTRLNIDCNRVNETIGLLIDTNTKPGKAIADCKAQIQASGKQITTFLVMRDNPRVNVNTCGGESNVLQNYGLALLKGIGLEPKPIRIDDFKTKLAEIATIDQSNVTSNSSPATHPTQTATQSPQPPQ